MWRSGLASCRWLRDKEAIFIDGIKTSSFGARARLRVADSHSTPRWGGGKLGASQPRCALRGGFHVTRAYGIHFADLAVADVWWQ